MNWLPSLNEDKNQSAGDEIAKQGRTDYCGDSGIGRAVSIAFAKEGADIAVVYRGEHKDAKQTEHLVEQHGRECLLVDGDVDDEKFCRKAVEQTVDVRQDRHPGEQWC